MYVNIVFTKVYAHVTLDYLYNFDQIRRNHNFYTPVSNSCAPFGNVYVNF